MARNEQTFKAVAKLEASQFKKEARNLTKVVNSMRNTFLGFAASLGAGLGLGQLVSSLRKTAVELSTAEATLENVSKETLKLSIVNKEAEVSVSNFGKTYAFVKRLARAYKQDLISLTNGYAQFKAASDQAGVSMEDQEKIYEALTRAAAFYHMSGDRTNDMMNAVIQMMSKGKVAAEELRRQLGNSLPGAFGLMATAAQKAGIATTGTVAELEDLMRKSKVGSKDVLPAFADELNKITEGLNLNSLQLDINELKNAWTNLTKELGFDKFFDNIIKGSTKVVNYIANNIRQVKADIIGAMTAILSFKLYGSLQKQGEQWVSNQNKLLRVLTSEYKKSFKQLDLLENKYGGLLEVKQPAGKAPTIKWAQGAKSQLGKKEVQEINAILADTQKKWADMTKQAGRVKDQYSGIALVGKGLLQVVKNIGATIASMGIVAIASAVIGYLTKIVSNAIQLKKELREIEDIGRDFGDGAKQAENAIEGQRREANALLDIIKDSNTNEKERLGAIKRLNELQGDIKGYTIDTKDTYDEIVKKTQDWLTELKKVQQVQLTLSQMQDNTSKLSDLEVQRQLIQEQIREHQHAAGRDDYGNTVWKDDLFSGNKERRDKLKLIDAEIKKRKDLNKTYQDYLDSQQVEIIRDQILNDNNNNNGGGGGGGNSKKKTPLELLTDVLDKYDQEVAKLNNQLKRGAITQEEFDTSMQKLVVDTYKEVAAFDNLEELIKKVVNGEQRLQELASESSMAKAWEDVEEQLKEADKEMDEYLDKLTKAQDEWMTYSRPKEGKRDSFFDYKSSDKEVLQGVLDVKEAYKKELTEAIEKAEAAAKAGVYGASKELEKLRGLLAKVMKETTDLGEKVKLAELVEDAKELQDQFDKGVFSGVKEFAQAIDRVGDGIVKIREAFSEDNDTSTWEKFTSILNEIVQLMDMACSAYETWNTLSKIGKKLTDAENAAKLKGISLDQAEKATSAAAASAKAGEAVAGATASGAKLAFPYNLIAIAAGIAAVVGALALMTRYENGGFVDGKYSHGDRNLVRVNKGEAILNPAQQRNFMELANGKAGGAGGDVHFVLRGDQLVGAIENYNSKRRG